MHTKPLNNIRLGADYMCITTALSEDNARFVATLNGIRGHA